jgi:hypothetical protein
MQAVFSYLSRNKKAILLTFEIFWIVVFLLEMAATNSGAGIPEFVYVNF